VVKIVVSLTEGEDRHEPGIPGRAFGRIRAAADVMTEGIDAERAVLEEYHPGNSRDEHTARAEDQPPHAYPIKAGSPSADKEADQLARICAGT